MAFRYVLVAISQLITSTDLPERFSLSTEECQVMCKSLAMHQQFMTSSSIHSLRVDVHIKTPSPESPIYSPMCTRCHRCLSNTQKLWVTHLDADFSGRASTDEFNKAARLRPNVSALPASEVGAGLNPTSAHWDPFYPWPAAFCTATHSQVSGVIITPHSLQVQYVHRHSVFESDANELLLPRFWAAPVWRSTRFQLLPVTCLIWPRIWASLHQIVVWATTNLVT